VRNRALRQLLEAFTGDAALQLSSDTARGAEVPFEVVETDTRPPLYCYRPLTGDFIRERLGLLSALPSYPPAARALVDLDGLDQYLRDRCEERPPTEPRERADAALRVFLGGVFAERSEFEFEDERFETAYADLERAVYDGRSVTTVLVPLLGVALDHGLEEIALGEGLSLMKGQAVDDAPPDAVWGESEEPNVLAVLTSSQDNVVSAARARFRKVLTALRLFERGGYALGPVAWTRADAGPWRTVPLGASGRPRLVTLISAAHEDELRAFCNLIARRMPSCLPRARHPASPERAGHESSSCGELAWALARFEMGCERLAPFEALTDYLLALRALLEPEGPGSGRLAGRLAAICAEPDDRAALAERTAHAISLERAMIAGLAPAEPGVDALVDELAEHLRAVLRDVLCGHLEADLPAVADGLLSEPVTM
jgi:hypothetical protein